MPSVTIQPRFLETALHEEFRRLPTVELLPVFARSSEITLPERRLQGFSSIDLDIFDAVDEQVSALNLKTDEVAAAITTISNNHSETQSINFGKAVIKNWKNGNTAFQQSREMVNWARQNTQKERRIICKAFKDTGQGELLVHNIGGMAPTDARIFMKEFLEQGGETSDVFSWLAEAGAFLRERQIEEPPTNGWLSDAWDAITDTVSDAADWVWGAISTVADAVEAALDDLGRAIGEIASWTIARLADVVRSLIAAGKNVAQILEAAFSEGVTALRKFVRAIIEAGHSMLSILQWAANEASNTLNQVLNALFQAGKNVVEIVKSVIRSATELSRKIINALVQLGHTVDDMIRAAINATSQQVRRLVNAFLQAGIRLADIIRETISDALSVLNKVLEALMALGRDITQILIAAANNLSSGFFERLVSALIALNHTVHELAQAILTEGSRWVRKLVMALQRIGQSIRDILRAFANQTLTILNQVMRALMAVGQQLGQILSAMGQFTGQQLRNLITALHSAFQEAEEIIIHFMRRSADIIRTVLEGLFAANLSFANAIRLILVNVAQAFQRNFFEGLQALGHSVVDIMREALKLTAALAALAFTTILEMFGGHRSLNEEERRVARQIFGWSIDLNRIKIAAASLPVDLILMVNGGRPFTTMHVINFASWQDVDMQTLVHELTHTWQGVETGPVYMVEALHEQFTLGHGAYEVTLRMLRENNGNFARFGREQQASLVDKYYYYTLGDGVNDGDAETWVNALTPYARQVYRPQFRIPDILRPIELEIDPTVPLPVRPIFRS